MTEVAEQHKKTFQPQSRYIYSSDEICFSLKPTPYFPKITTAEMQRDGYPKQSNTCLPVLLQQQKYFVRHHSSVYSLTRSSKDE